MKANLQKFVGMAALGMTLVANTVPTWADKPPTEVTGSVAVTNFPADQKVTVGNEVDVNVISPQRVQITIVAEDSGDPDVVTGLIERADGGTFSVVPSGKKVVLTDFIVSIGVPNDPVIGDDDDFLANIN